MCRNTVGIWTTASLKYSLITVKVVALEKVSFSDIENPKEFVNILTSDDKHYLLNRDNLKQPIQIQLSQKQKYFSEFFFCIFKIFIKF